MSKGFRTFLLGLITTALGLAAPHLPPDTIDAWAGVVLGAVGVGIIVLRVITDTPIFKRLAADAGVPAATLGGLRSTLATAMPAGDVGGALAALNDAIARLEGHPMLQPSTVATIGRLIEAAHNAPPAAPPPAAGPAAGPMPQAAPAPVPAAAVADPPPPPPSITLGAPHA